MIYRLLARGYARTIVAALVALVFAVAVTSVVLSVSGFNPPSTFQAMVVFGKQPDSLVNTLNKSATYYLSAVAVAIGFRMKLFNIGVDGQYRLAAMLAAAAGGAWALPTVLHQVVIIMVAALVGGLWAAIPAVLKVTRGVSEVISTIMLNFIASGVIAFLLNTDRLAVRLGPNNVGTKPIGPSGRVPNIPFPGSDLTVYGLVVLAVAVGVGYWFLVGRTRFGFELRASGMSPSAAVAGGVDAKRMVITAMTLSGVVAGLVGIPQLLGEAYTYSLDFPTGIGFTGIGIALLGRNNAIGIAFASLLWAFLEQSSQILEFNEIPKEIVAITEAAVLLSVVVVYEVVGRVGQRIDQRRVAARLGEVGGTA